MHRCSLFEIKCHHQLVSRTPYQTLNPEASRCQWERHAQSPRSLG